MTYVIGTIKRRGNALYILTEHGWQVYRRYA